MTQLIPPPLSELTTLRVGGPAARFAQADTEAELLELVRAADAAGEAVLLVAGGSNLLVCDAGFPGLAIAVRTAGVTIADRGDGYCDVTAAAGERWDDFVAWTLEQGLAGLEALSGIPGVGSARVIEPTLEDAFVRLVRGSATGVARSGA